MTLNGNKVYLSKSVTIKFRDKFKIRCMIKGEPLFFHVILKQGFTWFTLASNNPPIETVNIDILTDMACDLKLMCNFQYCYFHCALPEDTTNVDVTVRTLSGIRNFPKDCSPQSTTFSPWGTQVKPFPSLQKKINAYMEEKRKLVKAFTPAKRPYNRRNFIFPKKTTPIKRGKSDSKRVSKKQHKRKIEGCYVPKKAMMPTFTLSPAIVAVTPIVPKLPAIPNSPARPNLPATPKPPASTPTTSCETLKQVHSILHHIQTGQMRIGMEKDREKETENRKNKW